MAEEEATASESSVTMAEQAAAAAETAPIESQTSIEATIESYALGGAESTCNNNENEAKSGDGGEEMSLEFAEELTEKGTKALKENEFEDAVECFSRALEIRVKHFGELAPECITAYYHYGRALLYKAQEEADPLGSVPKKDSESKQPSGKDASVKISSNGESSSTSSKVQEDGRSGHQKEATNNGVKEQEDDEEESDDDELVEAEADEEDESDLDLSWKMLDLARAIADKNSGDTIDKVDVLSALAEVALEREDIETSLSDYQTALSILERLVETDSRLIAELYPLEYIYFLSITRMPFCPGLPIYFHTSSKAEEAVPYCEKAISVCKSRLQRLVAETKSSSESAATSAVSEMDEGVQQSSTGPLPDISVSDKEAEIETLTGLSLDLEKKLEDLQQLAVNPKSILQEILGMAAARARGDDQKTGSPGLVSSSSRFATNRSAGESESPTVSTAHTNGDGGGVTHLGVVGRGVKRMLMAPISPAKKHAVEASTDGAEGDDDAKAS
ncbi:unnamed protein product [Linum tenue]|uniref:Tetratricopeptide SHNi-TPR domain-containing protein n=1 Tax=Linum tenue TaxID=586396 RepID=A0AAV0NIV5_9ROSI|nr:unnamed protein product [Linum tenue]